MSEIHLFCSEFIDGCHALLSMASLTTGSLFDNLLKSIRSGLQTVVYV